MGQNTSIEWTHTTWNPTTGCTKVSAGCDHCYAHRQAHTRVAKCYLAKNPVVDSPENRQDPFAVRVWPDRLGQPASWRDPKMIFVNSMSDLFHVDIPEGFVRDVFKMMLEVDRHVYQILTKRPSRAARFYRQNADLFDAGPIPEHVWIGTSVESQDVMYRVDQLRDVAAEVRFLSCEPLLKPLDLNLTGIGWVIVGGESGPKFRRIEEEWVLGIRDQCVEAKVPFFFKQWGGYRPKAGGRLLEGRTWDEFPSEIDRLRTGGRK